MHRQLLWGSLLLAPATIAVDKLTGAGEVALFVLAAAALIPLAWLIGEATEHAAEHTGPGIGGFLNASFGNAPELIVALFAVGANLPVVVRGSLSGSVISNLLLVYGVTQMVGPDGAKVNRRSLLVQVGLVAVAVVALVLPTTLGYTGPPERHTVVVASVPVAAVLLLLYLVDRRPEPPPPPGARTRPRRARRRDVADVHRARRPRGGDRRDGVGERDPRPLAPRVCAAPSA